jgi:hypothetical protein
VVLRFLSIFTWPSAKKLSLVPLALVAAAVYWNLCKLAEWFPIPGVAEPTRSAHLWTVYTVLFAMDLIEVIGTTTRESPSWYLVPAWRAIRGCVYPFSILAARLCLPFVTLGLLDPTAGVWAGPLAALFFRHKYAPSATFNPLGFLRGARRLSADEKNAALAAKGGTTSGANGAPFTMFIRWLGFELPAAISEGHFCVIATPGGGKTLMQKELMLSVVPHVRPGSDRRVLIYDVKGDVLSLLHGANVDPALVTTMNPFDQRSVAWDLAADIASPQDADGLSTWLIPERKQESQPFFPNAARSVLKQVLLCFIQEAPGKWTLRHLIHVTASPKRLRAVLSKTAKGREVLEQFSKPTKTFRNFVQELGTAMRPLETVAALWEHADRKISLKAWAGAAESILVLDGRQEHRASLVPLNRILFNYLSSRLTSGPESPTRDRFWVFLDELQDASRLEGLVSLLNLGRSKGVRCVLGFQDMEGMHLAYGRDEGEKIAGLARNISMLKLTSPATAEWASRRLGDFEAIEYRRSWGVSSSVSEQFNRRQAVMPAEFLHLDDPARAPQGVRVKGFHLLLGVYGIIEHSAEIATRPNEPAVDFMPRPPEQQHLSEWNDEDGILLQVAPAVSGAMPARPTPSVPQPSPRKEPTDPAAGNLPKPTTVPTDDFDSLRDFNAPD